MIKSLFVALSALAATLLFASSGVEALTPGAFGAVSRSSIQNIVDKVYPPILEALKHVQVENIEGVQSGFKYELSNFKLNTCEIRAIDVGTQGSLRVDLRDLVLKATADWKYRKKGIPWVPRGSGWLEANLEAGDVGSTFTVTTTETPSGLKPLVTLSALTVDINNVKIKTHGSLFSWLYNLIIKLFKGKIKDAVVKFVRNAITNAVNAASAKIIDKIEFKKAFSKWGVVDFSLTSDMGFSNDLIVAPLNGEILSIATNTTDGQTPRPDLAFAGSSRMFAFVFSSFVVNSGLHVYHQSGRFDRYFTAESHPALFPLGFTTDAYAALIPALPAQHPGAAMTYRFRGREQSAVEVTDAAFTWHSKSVLGAYLAGATPAEDTLVFNLLVDLDAGAGLEVRADNPSGTPTIYVTLQDVSPAFRVEDSAVGPVDLALLSAVVHALVRDVLVPVFNVIFEDGIPIVAVKGFAFTNMALRLIPNAVVFETDVEYIPPPAVTAVAEAAAAVGDTLLSREQIQLLSNTISVSDE